MSKKKKLHNLAVAAGTERPTRYPPMTDAQWDLYKKVHGIPPYGPLTVEEVPPEEPVPNPLQETTDFLKRMGIE